MTFPLPVTSREEVESPTACHRLRRASPEREDRYMSSQWSPSERILTRRRCTAQLKMATPTAKAVKAGIGLVLLRQRGPMST